MVLAEDWRKVVSDDKGEEVRKKRVVEEVRVRPVVRKAVVIKG